MASPAWPAPITTVSMLESYVGLAGRSPADGLGRRCA